MDKELKDAIKKVRDAGFEVVKVTPLEWEGGEENCVISTDGVYLLEEDLFMSKEWNVNLFTDKWHSERIDNVDYLNLTDAKTAAQLDRLKRAGVEVVR